MVLWLSAKKEIMEMVETNSASLDEIVDSICNPYLKGLNDYVASLKRIASDNGYTELSSSELSQALIIVSGSLYALVNSINKVALRQAVATAIKTEEYSKIYNAETTTGTISDKKAKTELAVMSNTLIETVYKNCYNKLKTSYEAGESVYSGLKKIASMRVAEANLTNMQR
jgi:hypothetical protein